MGTGRAAGAIKTTKAACRAATAFVFATAVALCLLLLPVASAQAVTPKEALDTTGAYLVNKVKAPTVGSIGGEWAVIGLARAGVAVPGGYWDGYLGRVSVYVAARGDKLHPAKSTDNSRVILALTALGRDPRAIGGHDLVAPLADMDWVTNQGINGAIFALIATNSGGYEIPIDEGVANQTTEAKLIAFILNREVNKGMPDAGGWTLAGDEADPDITAMVLQASAPYYGEAEYDDLTQAVDRALIKLGDMQLADGGFKPAAFAGSEPCSESAAQVIIALTALGIDPTTDARFVKPGDKNPMTALLGFYQEDGSFKHDAAGSGESLMSTEQAMLALTAYDRLVNGKSALYDMSDAVEPAMRIEDIWVASHPVAPGTSVALPMRLEFDDGSVGDVAWASSAPAIAEVGGDGVLTGVTEGVVTLTAVATDGSDRTAAIPVTVAKAVTRLRTPLAKIYLVKGTRNWKPFVAADNITRGKVGIAARLAFESSRPNVARVSSSGRITARRVGTSTVTVRSLNGKKLSIRVTVTARRRALRSFGLSGLRASLKAGNAALLKLKPIPAKATNLKTAFKSSNPRIATVDAAGKVTAVKKGSVKITVRLAGKRIVKKLTVK